MVVLEERFKRLLEISKDKTETRVESFEGTPGRIISARLRPGTDLVTGIKEITKKHNILAGALTVSFGSLSCAEVTWKEGSKPDPSKKSTRIKVEGPTSFLSSQGKVGITEEGEAIVHLHGILVDWDGKMWGGHFYDGGNPVFSTFEIVIQEIAGVRHTKIWDDESGTKLLKAVLL